MELPNIETKITYEKFTFIVKAYRRLTYEEMVAALKRYMRENGLRCVPKTGTVTYQTIFGFDDL